MLFKNVLSDHEKNRQENTYGEDEKKITWGEDYLKRFFEINSLRGVAV